MSLSTWVEARVLPDLELGMRASGEARSSNCLLWHSAYAEYEFIDTLWPDFTSAEFGTLIGNYGGRDRRFGAVTA